MGDKSWKDQPGTSRELAEVIEEAMTPIEEAFGSVLAGVHEHGAREEREAAVRRLRELRGGSFAMAADLLEAGEHRKEA